MTFLALCAPGAGLAQDTQPKTGTLKVYAFSRGAFVSADGIHYRSMSDGISAVIAPATARDSSENIYISPDCTAHHSSIGAGTFGSTPSGFAVRFENGLELEFPGVKVDWKAIWPKLAHCTLDRG